MRMVIDLRGDRAALASDTLPPWPERPNSRTDARALSLIWAGPDRWLLLGPLAEEAALAAALGPPADPEHASITILSDSFAFFTLSGADARVAMAIACPLDLHPSAFAPDAATFSEMFGIRALVMRAPAGWTFAVAGSDAAYLDACLRQIV